MKVSLSWGQVQFNLDLGKGHLYFNPTLIWNVFAD